MSNREQELASEIYHLKAENKRLLDMFLLLRREKYGSKSERVEELSDQLIFNEIEAEAPAAPPEPKTVEVKAHKKGRGKKRPIPENVPREDVVIDLPEEKKTCPHDGARLKEIGVETSEKLKSYPARHVVSVIQKKKYACPKCESHVAQAKTKSILPGTIATPELLSFLIFSKYFQALPLYRLEELYKLAGIVLKRGTMARWLVQVAEKLIPVWNVLEEWMLASGYAAIDATSVQVLKEKGRAPQTKSFMWARGSPELGIILFDYNSSGSGGVARDLFAGFKGALQADAHRGYRALDRKELLLLGCMMHARRRFHKAWLLGGEKPGIAADALSMFKFIYGKEEQYRNDGLTPEQRKEWRDKEVGPSLAEIKKWCHWQVPKVLPSSPTGNALNYFINEYTELTAFLENGRYEIDNGWVERQIKRFAIGRKNWLFSDTVEGAEASSVLYSLALTAKLNSKDPFNVMAEVLTQLPKAESIDDYEDLAKMFLSEVNPESCRKKEGAIIH